MASLNGTPFWVDSSSRTGSTSIAVPANTKAIVVAGFGYRSEAMVFSGTIDGAAITVAAQVTADSNGRGFIGYLLNPSIGTVTFAWDWSDTPALAEGSGFAFIPVASGTSGIDFVDGGITIAAGGPTEKTVTIDSNASDLVIGVGSSYQPDSNPDANKTGQTVQVDNHTYNLNGLDIFTVDAPGASTTVLKCDTSYFGVASVSLRDSASGAITGTVNTTNLNDTATIAGLQPIQGATSKSESQDIAASTGRQPIVTESIKTESTDTSVVTSTLGPLSGASVVTEAPDTSIISGLQLIQSASIKTEAPDTGSITGLQPVQGASAKTEAPDTSAIEGLVGSSAIIGGSAATEAQDSSTISCLQPIQGTSVRTESPDTSIVSGAPFTSAISLQTERSDSSLIDVDCGSAPSVYGFVGLGKTKKEKDEELKNERIRRGIIPPELKLVAKLGPKPAVIEKQPTRELKPLTLENYSTQFIEPLATMYEKHQQGVDQIQKRRKANNERAMALILELV